MLVVVQTTQTHTSFLSLAVGLINLYFCHMLCSIRTVAEGLAIACLESCTVNGLSFHPPVPAIQWFGVDIGGTLVKCVYFETQYQGDGEGVAALKTFLKSSLKYGSSGIRDQRLEMPRQCLCGQMGTLHFIKFATSRMHGFFDMVTKNGLGTFPKVVCATGGGAFKFENDFREVSWFRKTVASLNSLLL